MLNVKICPPHAHRRTILISVMIMSNVSKTIRAQMDWPSVRYAQCQNMPSARAQANNPDIRHDDVERIQSHPHAKGLAFCPLCSTSKYALCTRTGGYIKVPFLALVLACPPHAETPRHLARANGHAVHPRQRVFSQINYLIPYGKAM